MRCSCEEGGKGKGLKKTEVTSPGKPATLFGDVGRATQPTQELDRLNLAGTLGASVYLHGNAQGNASTSSAAAPSHRGWSAREQRPSLIQHAAAELAINWRRIAKRGASQLALTRDAHAPARELRHFTAVPQLRSSQPPASSSGGM